jgi:general secretion pathway protein L
LALGVAYGWQAQQIQTLEQETAQLEAQAAQLFLQLAPEEGRVVNLSRQLQGRLQQVSSDQSSTRAVSPYHLLAHLGQALQKVTGATVLEQVSLRDQVYRIAIQAPQREQLDQLQQTLASPQWQVQLEQVVRVEDQYRGSFRLQGGAQ